MTAIALANHSAFGRVVDTLTLNSLSSFGSDFAAPYSASAGVRVLTSGAVQELVSNTIWNSQNPGVEWIDGFLASVASDYEVQLTKSAGTDPSSGPALATYHTISTTRAWQWDRTTVGSTSFSGTMTIREIANTANSVSAGVIITVEAGF